MSVRAFTFDRNFDIEPAPRPVAPVDGAVLVEDAPEEAQCPPEHELKYCDEDIERIRAEAFEEGRTLGEATGRDAGLQEAQASNDQVIANALEAIRVAMPNLNAELLPMVAELEARATRLLLTLARRLVPSLSEAAALGEAQRIARDAINHGADAPKIIVEMGGAIYQQLSLLLENGLDGSTEKSGLEMRQSDDVGPRAVRVCWGSGSVDYDPDHLVAEIMKLLDRAEVGIDERPEEQGADEAGESPKAVVDVRGGAVGDNPDATAAEENQGAGSDT